MITIWLLVAITPKQRVSGLNSLILSFPSLSVTSQLLKWLTPVIAIWLLMAIPPKKGLAAQFHWLKGSALVNINGGHFEGYIRKAGIGSVPKIANIFTFVSLLILTLQGKTFVFQGSFHHSLQVGMFYIIDCFSGLKARVAYGCSLGIGT